MTCSSFGPISASGRGEVEPKQKKYWMPLAGATRSDDSHRASPRIGLRDDFLVAMIDGNGTGIGFHREPASYKGMRDAVDCRRTASGDLCGPKPPPCHGNCKGSWAAGVGHRPGSDPWASVVSRGGGAGWQPLPATVAPGGSHRAGR